ncbi:50S ribosomal protein L9 [Patescibacteria group bacterium]|nr:50S ribosomal protein L9 [Patescibacteria group bacterium]
MKVILTKDVQDLGKNGDIKDVSDGYARNFLIPAGSAKIATKNAIKQSEAIREKRIKEVEESIKLSKDIVNKIKGFVLNIQAKSENNGKLYAAIKPEEISTHLIEKGFQIKKDNIVIEKPIKELGDYEVLVIFDYDLKTKVNLTVESDKKK